MATGARLRAQKRAKIALEKICCFWLARAQLTLALYCGCRRFTVADHDKAQIKALAPQGLGDADSKVRTAAAMLVARIAQHEWPAQVYYYSLHQSKSLSFCKPTKQNKNTHSLFSFPLLNISYIYN